MKFKFFLLLASAAMLTACGGKPVSADSSVLPSGTSSAQEAAYLDWVNDGKIVIDLFDDGEARFTYGNAALSEASQTLDLDKSAKLACSTTLDASKTYNFIFVTEEATGTGFNAGAGLYSAIEGDKLSLFLSDTGEDLKAATRAYIAISFGSTVSWTKGKNAAMDAKIQQLVDAAKK